MQSAYVHSLLTAPGTIVKIFISEFALGECKVKRASLPYGVESNVQESRDYISKSYTPPELKELTEEILNVLKEEYPEFIFSHMVKYIETCMEYKNSENLNLKQTSSEISIGLLLKEKSFPNIMDGYMGYGGRNFDLDKFWT